MTHPIMLEALAGARQADMRRRADRGCGVVLERESRRRRARLAAWLKGQLRPTAPAGVTGAARYVADSRPGVDEPAPGWFGSPVCTRC
jgi:hypothetical protein